MSPKRRTPTARNCSRPGSSSAAPDRPPVSGDADAAHEGVLSARRTSAVALLVIVVVALVAARVWWTWGLAAPTRALDAGWAAVVLTIAGDGTAGSRDGDVAAARFSDPFGVAVATDGAIYISDAGDAQRIRRLSGDDVVTTVAGGERGFVDGAGSAAKFDTPSGLAVDRSGALYVADTGNNAIRRITSDG